MKMNNLIIDISYHNGQVDLSKAKESISGVIAVLMVGVIKILINNGVIMLHRLIN